MRVVIKVIKVIRTKRIQMGDGRNVINMPDGTHVIVSKAVDAIVQVVAVVIVLVVVTAVVFFVAVAGGNLAAISVAVVIVVRAGLERQLLNTVPIARAVMVVTPPILTGFIVLFVLVLQ